MSPRGSIFLLLLCFFIGACSPTKRLGDHQALLDKNHVVAEGVDLSKEELREVLVQQPNKRILPWTRFHLHMYNLPSAKRLELSRSRKDARRLRKDQRRVSKGKPPGKNGRTKWEWLRDVVGEPPVIIDTAKVLKSEEQLATFLTKKGYFQNEVTSSIETLGRKRVEVTYNIKASQAYYLDSIAWRLPEGHIGRLIRRDYRSDLLVTGQRFDVDNIAAERASLAQFLRNRGFYGFSKKYLRAEVDSAVGQRKVHIDMILDPVDDISAIQDPLELGHQRYSFGSIRFHCDWPLSDGEVVLIGGYSFEGFAEYPLRKKVLLQNTFIEEGRQYRQRDVDRTYRRLTALSAIDHVRMQVEPDSVGRLIVDIYLSPTRRQNVAAEAQGTNSGGFLGVEGNLVYRHKNVFKGSEVLELQFNGGVQAQALLTDNAAQTEQELQRDRNLALNTLEFGPSLQLRLPKFLLPLPPERFAKSADPTTVLSVSYNLQDRPDFQRELFNFYLGYRWKENDKKQHQVNPLEVSVIRIDKSDVFQQRLEQFNDQFLLESYQNHFITSSSYTFTYADSPQLGERAHWYFRGNAELGGNLLRSIYGISDATPDSTGSYRIFGIRFAHYAKVFSDLRYYNSPSDKNTFVLRLAGGVGVPLENLGVLPFAKSFFGGGANGLRAWRARTIGPGSFFEPIVTYDKIGDIQIEVNAEYRFNLFDYLHGAFFLDAGNIWLLDEDPLRPGGHFESDRFLSEIAIGGGFGLRLDFNYFLLRFDLGMQLKDPSLIQGQRWFFQSKDDFNDRIRAFNATLPDGANQLSEYGIRLNFNLGIGYPF